ncbi:hypothetical protein FB45DRAFT_1005698 [Roridomyces roridus]|uniref:Uncharacterized protein n=1 Tax=Roridomyces roridus TaxID=1738132 RepID=A0AAD7BJG1_9AGAR|nr:hypothetical protein FB45DRAFT_1005698 [Roridomyces roridus]
MQKQLLQLLVTNKLRRRHHPDTDTDSGQVVAIRNDDRRRRPRFSLVPFQEPVKLQAHASEFEEDRVWAEHSHTAVQLRCIIDRVTTAAHRRPSLDCWLLPESSHAESTQARQVGGILSYPTQVETSRAGAKDDGVNVRCNFPG